MVSRIEYPVGTPFDPDQIHFGTDGIRGRVGTVITPALALQLGYWCGRVLPEGGPILIGMDSRNSGPMLVAALAAGLTAAGRDVFELGLCPTPAVPGAVRRISASGGLMVSASHNPPHDNGIKVFGSCGAKLGKEQQARIEAGLHGAGEPAAAGFAGTGTIHQRGELLAGYREALLESVSGCRLDGVSVVLDLCWGSATSCAEGLFRALGADLTVLNGSPEGSRINQGCGSTHLEGVQAAVLEQGAAMGFAFDGDADRVLAVDGRGRVIDGDQILFLWGRALMAERRLPDQRIVATVMSNLGFENAWRNLGGVLERTAVGDQYVHAAMEKLGAALGGEQSGHILSARHGLSGDGLLTALQVATLVHGQGLSLAEWRDHSFDPYPQKLVNVTVPDRSSRRGWRGCEPLMAAIDQAERSMAGHGRVLVRDSGTEPLLRVMVEAADQRDVDHWCTELAALVRKHLSAP
ncbi:MAG: phosphoglucosamine mutase [Cyanobacteriota bacterium]|nr:phosphoglucosamine mutase [Cyanobacteriota bacterium]